MNHGDCGLPLRISARWSPMVYVCLIGGGGLDRDLCGKMEMTASSMERWRIESRRAIH